MRARTLEDLRTEARERADMDEDDHITEAMWNRFINQGIQRTFRRLCKVAPDRYFTSDDISTTAGTAAYDLPSNFAWLLGVDLVRSADNLLPLEPFSLQERIGPLRAVSFDSPQTRYDVRGNGDATQIYFDPDPGTETYRVYYVYVPDDLVDDDDVFDGTAGFEDSVIEYAILLAQRRSEDDTSDTRACLADADAAIDALATRDAGRPARIIDVRKTRRRR
jgi:hypothetical protein